MYRQCCLLVLVSIYWHISALMVKGVIIITANTSMQLAVRISQFFSEANFSIAIFSEAIYIIWAVRIFVLSSSQYGMTVVL